MSKVNKLIFSQTDERDKEMFNQTGFDLEIDVSKISPKIKNIIIQSADNNILVYTISNDETKDIMIIVHEDVNGKTNSSPDA